MLLRVAATAVQAQYDGQWSGNRLRRHVDQIIANFTADRQLKLKIARRQRRCPHR